MERYCLPADFIYSRWNKDGKVVRVAVMSIHNGIGFAFYPTPKPGIFGTEVFMDSDTPSVRPEWTRGAIDDDILVSLLEGRKINEITSVYYPSIPGQFYFSPRNKEPDRARIRTFGIIEHEEKS